MTDATARARPIARASLIARHALPAAIEAAAEAAAYLAKNGCAPSIEARTAAVGKFDARWPVVPREQLARNSDVVLAFGGDGTLLEAAGAVAHSSFDAPLVGINLGHLGFLTEVGRADMTIALDRLIAGQFTSEDRLLLAGQVSRDGVVSEERLALNDVVVTRGALARMIEIDVEVDAQFVSHVKADGLIVATATGSTAYNRSAGGPILHPSVDAVVVTPLAPHALTNRPLVLDASSRIVLKPRVDPDTDPVVTFDGQYGIELRAGDCIEITRAARRLRLLRTASRSHFSMLREKLRWGGS